jgi:hypothetical protein
MTKPSTGAHDLPSMHVRPFKVRAGLAALRRGPATDLMRVPTSFGANAESLKFARRRQSR